MYENIFTKDILDSKQQKVKDEKEKKFIFKWKKFILKGKKNCRRLLYIKNRYENTSIITQWTIQIVGMEMLWDS